MYQKYHTEAFVLGHREAGESDRVYAFFTKEFGLVRARAGAVRTEYSKMRYALQTASRVDVSLVRGKKGWRVAGAVALPSDISGAGLSVFVRTARLVLRLVAGEEKNEYLFQTLSDGYGALAGAKSEHVPVIELACVARVLYSLGYISAESLGTALFTHTSLLETHIGEVEEKHDEILASVNRALSETHL